MRREPAWRRYLRLVRPDVEGDVRDELAFHLGERIQELIGQGVSPEDARRRAEQEFGDLGEVRRGLERIGRRTLARRERVVRRSVLGLELRQAIRRLLRTPTFTLSTAITLGLGIGATTAIYVVLDAVVLRPLPYPAADRLVALSSPVPGVGQDAVWGLARHEMFYFERESRLLEALGVYRVSPLAVGGDGAGFHAERARAALVSSTLLQLLGFRPLLGRLLLPEDNLADPARVVVLSHGYWLRRFGGDPAIVGRQVQIEGASSEVVGVLPPEAQLPSVQVDLWSPAHVDPASPAQSNHVYLAIGRLRPGASAEGLERELAPLTARFPEIFPDVYSDQFMKGTGFRTAVIPLRDEVVGETVARTLWILLASVGLLMVIAAVNVANLVLVRVEGRRREMAVRQALGAGRRNVAVHFLVEGLLLAALSGGLAAGLAALGLDLLLRLAPSTLPRLAEVRLGAGDVAVALGLALAGGLVLALIATSSIGRARAPLVVTPRAATPERRRYLVRSGLVVGQVALAMVLLAGAALLLRSFVNLKAVEPGFDADGVTVASLALPRARFGLTDFEVATSFYRQLDARIRALPGVRAVGFGEMVPLATGAGCTGIIPEREPGRVRNGACVVMMHATPGYFEALGIEVRGRAPDWAETESRTGGIVVSRALAERLWPGEDPMGKGLRCCRPGPGYYRVVGVTGDVRALGLDAPPLEAVYVPVLPLAGDVLDGVPTYMQVVIRTAAGAGSLGRVLPAAVAEVAPDVAVANVQPMEVVVARSVASRSFTLILLGLASGLAVLLSAVGLYGVIGYVVGERRREIGIRMALGADRRRVGRQVVAGALGLALIGVAFGGVLALGTTRVLAGLLFGVAPTDPETLAVVALVLTGVASVAGYLPARRAMAVDPVATLRVE